MKLVLMLKKPAILVSFDNFIDSVFVKFLRVITIWLLLFETEPEPSEHAPNGLEEEPEEKAAPVEKPEIVSWRRKPEDDDKRPASPSRGKGYSPERRRRQNGWYHS